jgi:UPF0042 nucleotide-binding protein
MLQQVRDIGISTTVLFLECDDDVLIRRYSETRRPHRYAEGGNVAEGIAMERVLLQLVKEQATMVIDTSGLTLYQLKQLIGEVLPKCRSVGTLLKIISFGYKHGLPPEADMVFDARFLPNPFYIPELRQLTGQDAEILEYLKQFKQFDEFLDRLEDWIAWSWPHVLEETKAYHCVAVGCTGGRHRSVALAENLAGKLAGRIENIVVQHRDLQRHG